jgi:hypothetical protein
MAGTDVTGEVTGTGTTDRAGSGVPGEEAAAGVRGPVGTAAWPAKCCGTPFRDGTRVTAGGCAVTGGDGGMESTAAIVTWPMCDVTVGAKESG